MYTIDKDKFGPFIAALRREKGLTQRALAEKLFVSDKAVSKWERGASIPDTALLIPLAEILGVTVTELLECRRREGDEPLDPDRVEGIVKTAVHYGEDTSSRADPHRKKWAAAFVAALGLCLLGFWLLYRDFWSIDPAKHYVNYRWSVAPVLTLSIISAIDGGYFCFFARTRLPAYFDENRISSYSDAFFRMNVPGVAFNNANWPYILRVGRVWCLSVMGLFPLASYFMMRWFRTFWFRAQLPVLAVLLVVLFAAMIVAARRHQR